VIPYDAACIAISLRKMDGDRLASVTPHDFQRHPLQAITKGAVIAEMIATEKHRRSK